MARTSGIVLGQYYSAGDLENMTDGEVLDLVYYVVDNYSNTAPAYAKLDLIKTVLKLSEGKVLDHLGETE